MNTAPLPLRIRKRIAFAHVENNPVPGPCWIWTGAASTYGLTRWGGHMKVVHRVTYETLVGPVPDGLELDHRCLLKLCCNPEHLEAVTHQENVDRAAPHEGRPKWTECKYGHELTEDNVKVRVKGKYIERTCIQCNRRRGRNAMRVRRARQVVAS